MYDHKVNLKKLLLVAFFICFRYLLWALLPLFQQVFARRPVKSKWPNIHDF